MGVVSNAYHLRRHLGAGVRRRSLRCCRRDYASAVILLAPLARDVSTRLLITGESPKVFRAAQSDRIHGWRRFATSKTPFLPLSKKGTSRVPSEWSGTPKMAPVRPSIHRQSAIVDGVIW